MPSEDFIWININRCICSHWRSPNFNFCILVLVLNNCLKLFLVWYNNNIPHGRKAKYTSLYFIFPIFFFYITKLSSLFFFYMILIVNYIDFFFTFIFCIFYFL